MQPSTGTNDGNESAAPVSFVFTSSRYAAPRSPPSQKSSLSLQARRQHANGAASARPPLPFTPRGFATEVFLPLSPPPTPGDFREQKRPSPRTLALGPTLPTFPHLSTIPSTPSLESDTSSCSSNAFPFPSVLADTPTQGHRSSRRASPPTTPLITPLCRSAAPSPPHSPGPDTPAGSYSKVSLHELTSWLVQPRSALLPSDEFPFHAAWEPTSQARRSRNSHHSSSHSHHEHKHAHLPSLSSSNPSTASRSSPKLHEAYLPST